MPHTFLRRTQEFNLILEKIFENLYTPLCDLDVEAFHSKEPLSFADRQKGKPIKIRKDKSWGKLYDCAWFHFTGQVPKEAAGKKVSLRIDLGGEGCVFDAKGNPVLGLTSVADQNMERHFFAKRMVPVAEKAKGGEKIDLWVDGGSNDLWEFTGEHPHPFRMAEIVEEHPELEQLYFDYEMLLRLAEELEEESPRRHQILFTLHQATMRLDTLSEEEARAARKTLAPALKKRNADPPLSTSAVGHAHLDLAWLWPIRETIRKAGRTFSTAVALMDRYPEYVFGQSQPQVYEWMREHYPGLFKRIKEKVAAGQWELQGGMWVEADTNTTSGESLVRQILYGKQYFNQEFGFESKMLWLPDVFGYSAALPQILKKCDIDYFMTQKLSWSLFNKFPHHTFFWRGTDGTRVLTHMLPSNTYNNCLLAEHVLEGVKNFQDKAVSDRFLVCYGIGDGGGGPSVEMLERLRRQKNLQGLPPMRSEGAEKFFRRIDRGTEHYAEWSGELYLERHRGTYTTHGAVKRYNRLMEDGLFRLEWLSCLAGEVAGANYPREAIDRLWKETLLYQFHDILPGSSITRVYDECKARYAVMLEELEGLCAEMEDSVLAKLAPSRGGLGVFNSLGWERREWVRQGGKWYAAQLPALGVAFLDGKEAVEKFRVSASRSKLENERLRVRFGRSGQLVSVYDKQAQREVLREGETGNQLLVFEDQRIGPAGDAWDMRETYMEQEAAPCRLESSEARVDGPLGIVEQEWRYGKSVIRQQVVLAAGSGRLEFRTQVDWQERGRMLRVRFPVSVRSEKLDCGIQYGACSRPTHRNTSWDQARFEVAARGWVDLSQRDYGVALLSDCKYGFCPLPDTLDLHLLRGSNAPDPVADLGEHRFTYGLYPHEGDYGVGGVVRESAAMLSPARTRTVKRAGKGESKRDALSLVSIRGQGAEQVTVEALKRSEDGEGLVLRLAENGGGEADLVLGFGLPVRKVERVNMLERRQGAARLRGGELSLRLAPYEVETLKLLV